MHKTVIFVELTHKSPEFDASYDVFGKDIPPEFLEEREFLRNRLRVRDEGATTDQEKILAQEGYTLHLIAVKKGEKSSVQFMVMLYPGYHRIIALSASSHTFPCSRDTGGEASARSL